MTTSTNTTAWPDEVIARYLTVGGATVDVAEVCGYYDRTDPTTTVGTCTGCGERKAIDWTRMVWNASGRYVEETDEGGQFTTPKVREWAQAHAEKCRAMPKP